MNSTQRFNQLIRDMVRLCARSAGKKLDNRRLKRIYRTYSRESRLLKKNDILTSRMVMGQYIDSQSENGQVFLTITSTDCDCFTSSYVTGPHTASVMVIDRLITELYDGAEGPTFIDVVSPSYAKDFVGHSRDMALEAHENGHPHYVY